jgi:hypothetical protein
VGEGRFAWHHPPSCLEPVMGSLLSPVRVCLQGLHRLLYGGGSVLLTFEEKDVPCVSDGFHPNAHASLALRLVTGKYCLPDARNETLRPCRVRRVFVAKLLNHHSLLRAEAKRAEDRERDQVRRTCHPIRDDERLADGIQR